LNPYNSNAHINGPYFSGGTIGQLYQYANDDANYLDDNY